MKPLTTGISRQDVRLLKAESMSEKIAQDKEVTIVALDTENFKKFLKQAQRNQWTSYAIATVSFAHHAFFKPADLWYVVNEKYTERNYYSYDIYNFLNNIATSEKEQKLVDIIKKIADSYYEYKLKKYSTIFNKGKYHLHDDAFDIKKIEASLKENRKHFLNLAGFLMKGDADGFKKYIDSLMSDNKNKKIPKPRINEISLNYRAYYHAFRKIDAKYPDILEALNSFLTKYNIKLVYRNAMILCWDGYPAVLEPKNFIDTVKKLHKDYLDALDDPSRVLDFHKVIHKYLVFFEGSYKAPYVPNGVFDPFLSEEMSRKAAMVEPVFDNGTLYSYVISVEDFLATAL